MKRIQLFGIAGNILAGISAWLPWATTNEKTWTGFMKTPEGIPINFELYVQTHPGMVAVAIAVLSAIFIFLNNKWSRVIAFILSPALLAWAVKHLLDVRDSGIENMSAGYGLYLLLAGGIIAIVCTGINLWRNQSFR